MITNVMVISSDGHATLPLDQFRPYLERRYFDEFDAMIADDAVRVTVRFEDLLDPEIAERYHSVLERTGAREFQSDPDARVRLLANEGIVAEVIFPDGAPFGAGAVGSGRTQFSPELELAGARAYNRWISEYCSGSPGLGGQSIISLFDVAEAVEDVYWAKEHGCIGLYMPGMDDSRPLYWDPVYEPLWAACAEVGLPLNFHGGTGMPLYRSMGNDVPYFVRARLSGFEFPFWAHRPLWFMIWSGVLERHPQLRLAFTEQHSDWVHEAIAKMDHSYEHSFFDAQIKAIVPNPPSYYFERQVWLGSSQLSRAELVNRDSIGFGKMMFGADIPHPEGTIGVTREYLRATVGAAGMPESDVRSFLGERALDFYGFDLAALEPMVALHGPPLDDIMTPLPKNDVARLLRGRSDVQRPALALTGAAIDEEGRIL